MILMRKLQPFILITFTIVALFSICSCAKKPPEESLEIQKPPEEVEIPKILPISKDKDAESKDSGSTESQIKLEIPNEEQKILSFDMTGFAQDGKKKWDIQGKSADIVSDTVILRDIEANAYSKDRTIELQANNGVYDKQNSSVKLEENVVVTTSDGVTLTTKWLKWESDTNTIKTDSFVEVVKDNFYACGYGASANTGSKEVLLNKDIVVKQGEVTISCGGPLTIDYAKNQASFCDKVKVTEPRGELIADRLDIFFNPESRQIEKVIAERNVELRQGQNVAKGQKIIYTLASGEAILTGNPEILIYSQKDLEGAIIGE